MSTLRSNAVLKIREALAVAAEDGYGLRATELKRLIPSSRDIFGVVWELRCWGAETIAVKKGKKVIGWVMKNDLPIEHFKSASPTPQTSIPLNKKIFRPIVGVKKERKKQIFKAIQPRPLTKAATKWMNHSTKATSKLNNSQPIPTKAAMKLLSYDA